jgi:hypothetical protein
LLRHFEVFGADDFRISTPTAAESANVLEVADPRSCRYTIETFDPDTLD